MPLIRSKRPTTNPRLEVYAVFPSRVSVGYIASPVVDQEGFMFVALWEPANRRREKASCYADNLETRLDRKALMTAQKTVRVRRKLIHRVLAEGFNARVTRVILTQIA